jgi:hypothetical protein
MTFLFSMSAWAIVGYGTFSIINSLRKGMATVKHLHEIPCARCQYFTHNYSLKCTVHPYIALTESAIGCRDQEY